MTKRVAMNLLWCVPGVGGSEEYLVRQLMGLSEITCDFVVDVFAPRGFEPRAMAEPRAFFRSCRWDDASDPGRSRQTAAGREKRRPVGTGDPDWRRPGG